jgi:lysophospholipase L1-like esterase
MSEKTYTYLALGDSYTIGESVPANQNFPSQAIELIRKEGYNFINAIIVAKTGWTTDELEEGISKAELNTVYDFVSLLIGVNNQYRGKSLEEYANEFDELLKKAIGFAGNKATHVIVLSIPDWGVTPYAKERNRQKIASEIDAFNQVNKAISDRYKVNYVDITQLTREAANDLSLLTEDELHPSGKDYQRWAEKLVAIIQQQLK